ncbi:hypothetical protein N431DRAFT_549513 [Stipitochalara longipes BDJ]|nr:hypothetical protein N431DRAFT_549513 [Stipitochalara longipes BDJ]
MIDGNSSVPERATLKQLGLRACGTCVKAKVKCVPNPQQNRRCSRCQRLDKPCEPAASSRKKRTQPQNVMQLEKKLDDLVNLLIRPKHQDGIEQAQTTMSKPASATSLTSIKQAHQAPELAEPDSDPQPGLESNQPKTRLSPVIATPQFKRSHFDLPNQEGAFLLLEFRTSMAPQFPFVVIPQEATSESLRNERPMLWKAIVTAASCLNPSRQEVMGWEIMEELTTRLLLKAEKSLDLLQALLIHIAWYHYHSVINPQFVNLIGLAKSLAANLGLHRPRLCSVMKEPRPDPVKGDQEFSIKAGDAGSSDLNSKTLEEWRAMAGVFFLGVVTYTSLKKTDPLPFTPHLKECCERLIRFQEYESDKLLVQLVAIQHISLKFSAIFNETGDYTGSSKISPRIFIKSMQGELDNFKRNLSFELQHHPCILCYYQSVEIRLYEIGLSYSASNDEEMTYRIGILYSFLMAVKTFLSTHFSHSYPLTAARAHITMMQSEYAIRMGIKLLRQPATDGWDSDHARNILDFPSVIEMAVSKIESLIRVRSRSREQPSRGDVFARYLNNLKCVKDWSQSLETSSGELKGSSGAGFRQLDEAPERQDLDLVYPEGQSFSDGILTAINSDNLLWDVLNGPVDYWMAFES